MKLLYSKTEIEKRVKQLGSEIREKLNGQRAVFICVLKGAVVFFCDLIRELGAIDGECDFISVASYGSGKTSSGEVRLKSEPSVSLENKHIIIVEDIVDSGHTLCFLKEYMEKRKAASVTTVALLDKKDGRKLQIDADFTAFTLSGSPFAVGYGLDFDQKYRHLPDIYDLDG